MYAILGLGNPGERYRQTRHNIGFTVVERLGAQLNVEWQQTEFYLYAATAIETTPVVLVKPITFVNRSGLAAIELKQQFSLSTTEIMVVLDDVNLPLGKIRLRLKGSDGGHKGLASLIWSLQSQQFPRLRLGIGPLPEETELTEFVLGEFEQNELQVVQTMVARAVEVIKLFVSSGAEKAWEFLSQLC